MSSPLIQMPALPAVAADVTGFAYVIATLEDQIRYHESDMATDPECHVARIAELRAAIQKLTAVTVPVPLLERTHCVEYSPNCPSRWLVRLPGRSAVIDKLPYLGMDRARMTADALGFGSTLEEAATAAIKAKEALGTGAGATNG